MAASAERGAVKTTCPYCGVGCGVLARDTGDGAAEIKGDAQHPANFGRLCVKGSHLGDTVDLEGRLLHPEIAGQRVGWVQAVDAVAGAFRAAIDQHGPDSVAFYVSGQLLTEDYYVANKLMKGFIGSGNIDTNSRLCMASSVAGHKRGFGADIVPGVYEDLEQADLIVLVGSNLEWCHPVLAQRIAAARTRRPGLRVVNIDPRRTATSENADTHLGLAPGADVALFNGLLAHLQAEGRGDAAFVEAHVADADAALAQAAALSPSEVAAATGLSEADLQAFYRQWAGTERVVTVYSQGVNQWSSGVDKVNAILNCHLYTGRIGRPGCGPFSVTGQPNAMGGREVGGLANMLAAHMEIANPRHRNLVRRFWGAPNVAETPGLKAVDMFEALASGRIKALWVMATNPAVSLPQADRVREALRQGDAFVAVSDVMRRTDTTELADVLLPATAWGEKDGTVTNSERRISRQRAFLAPPGEARADWRIIADVAAAMGWREAFNYDSPAAVFREHAALSGFENEEGERLFDISDKSGITDGDYAALQPFHWPAPARGPRRAGAPRLFGEGGFATSDRKARMIAVQPSARGEALSERFPLILNTGRVRDHWHTMTRTAKSARLSRHIAEPYLEIHPSDAEKLALEPATLARIVSAQGAMIARVLTTERQQPGSVFAPMHWTAQTASLGRVDALVAPLTDPISGQPESKRTPVRVEPYSAIWYGFAVTRGEPRLGGIGYWAKARTGSTPGWRVELADDRPVNDIDELAVRILGLPGDASTETTRYQDERRGTVRLAAYREDRLLGALFLSNTPVAAARDWLADALDSDEADADRNARLRLLAGRGGGAQADQGPIVCVCHSVGARRIEAAVAAGADSVDAIGKACAAGTNCGSCRPELKAFLSRRTTPLAAE